MGRALGRTLPCARIPNASCVHEGIAELLGTALIALILLASPNPVQAQTTAALPSVSKALANSGRAEPIRAWVQLCRETSSRTVTMAGLFGSAWFTCEVTTPSAEDDSERLASAERWCVEVVVAAGTAS